MSGDRALPVVEVFGPTIQGEGPDAGLPTHFVRFGGCDYRCSWCDSMHAVEPALVREAERMTLKEVARRVYDLGPPRRVVLSGGNPALHDLLPLVRKLRDLGYAIGVETQGSVWRDWLGLASPLVVSPKPPSSGVPKSGLARFMERARRFGFDGRIALKVVVFDEGDLEWTVRLRERYPRYPLYLCVGTPVGRSDAETRAEVARRYVWLVERVAGRQGMQGTRVLPQLHVVAFGTRRRV